MKKVLRVIIVLALIALSIALILWLLSFIFNSIIPWLIKNIVAPVLGTILIIIAGFLAFD